MLVEVVLIVLSVASLGLTVLLKKPVKCEVLHDAVKQEVIVDEKENFLPSLEVAP